MDVIGSAFHPVLSDKKVSLKDASLLCSLRIKKVQQYLQKNNVDGLLSLNGIDSHYNPDCRHFLNFILFGHSMYKSGNYSKYSDSIDIDEIILLIKQTKVDVYLSYSSIDSVLPFLLKIHDLQIHCLDANVSADETNIEDHKVYSFISMTENVKKIAIPYTVDPDTFDQMLIEKWPLFQAFALEDYGSKGFFGLSHEIVPLNFEKSPLFFQFDLGSLKHLLTDTCILLKYQWNTMVRNISNMINNDENINLRNAMDPIISYLEHNSNAPGQIKYQSACHAVTTKPIFITCLVKEPQGSLGCARTYFIHENIDSSDLILLSSIYDAVVSTAHKTIQRFMTVQNSSKLQQYFLKKFSEKFCSYKYPQLSSFKTSKLKIETLLEAYDVKGIKVKDNLKLSLKTFSVSISNIESLQKTQFIYEPIIFKETFIDSHINVKNETSSAIDTELLIVTDVIPTYVQWNKSIATDEEGVPCSLFSNDPNTYEAFFKLNDGSIEIVSPYSTPLQIRLSDLKEVKSKRSGSVAVAVHFEHSSNCLPPFLRRFCLIFWQRGRGIKFATEKLLPQINESGISEPNNSLPCDVLLRFENLVSIKSGNIGGNQSCHESEIIQNYYPTYTSFAPHFTLSSLGDYTYNQQDVNPNIDIEIPEPFIFITVIVGIPGSNQEKICSLITENSKEYNCQFIVLRQPLGSEHLFNANDLQNTLFTLSQRGNDTLRVLVVVSAYVEIPEIISPIVHHSDKRTRQACHISSVNTCVDVRNLFICNKTCIPKITEQCQEGWTNNIIVTGLKQSGKDERLQFLRRLNPHCNIIEVHGNNFIDKESMVEVCSTDLFYNHPLPISRNLSAPGWFSKHYTPCLPFIDIKYVSVSFEGVLCKARFMSHLKSLHQKEGRVYLDRLLASGSIFYLAGRTKFSDDANTLYSIECTPRSDAISLTVFNKPLPPAAKNCFIFTGYQISEDQVKSWLEGCLPKTPSKKEKYTKYMLTPEECQMLKNKTSKEELPEGWFYNGTSYVSMLEGGKKMEHPKYESIVEKYLDEKNCEIEKFNSEIEKIKVPSLFGGV